MRERFHSISPKGRSQPRQHTAVTKESAEHFRKIIFEPKLYLYLSLSFYLSPSLSLSLSYQKALMHLFVTKYCDMFCNGRQSNYRKRRSDFWPTLKSTYYATTIMLNFNKLPLEQSMGSNINSVCRTVYINAIKLFFCWMGHLNMSFYYPTSPYEGKGVVYFLYITL